MGVVYFSIIPTFEPSRYCKCWIVCFYNISAGNIESTDTKQILTDPQEITSLDDKAISSSKVYTDIVVEVTSTATAGTAEGTTSGVSNETVKLFVK